MIGVVDVGGGNRGAFGAGVFDYCLDNGIVFDYCIGVSAGSANCASYLANQKGRNLRFYTKHNISSNSMSLKNKIMTHSFLDLNYIFGVVSNSDGIDPLDFDTLINAKQNFFMVATNAKTGLAEYFSKYKMEKDNYKALAASCNLPVVNSAYKFDGKEYFDGGLSDPIPFKRAFSDGCDRLVIILTLPKDYYRKSKRDSHLAKLELSYPKIKEAIINRYQTYNDQLNEILELEKDGRVLIIFPKKKPNMDTLGKDTKEIIKIYNEAYYEAEKIKEFFKH